MRRMRKLTQAFEELKLNDPNTGLTPYRLRQMVLTGEVPCYHAGRTMLIDMQVLEDILGGKTVSQTTEEIPGNYSAVKMRRIGG